jgi:hypothetical protein
MYFLLNKSPRYFSSSSPNFFLLFRGEKYGQQLVTALTNLAADLVVGNVVAEPGECFLPGARV